MSGPHEGAPATDEGDDRRVGDRYRAARLRLTELLEGIDDAAWETPVPACPGWRVRDVLAHLVGIIEDAAEGKISGPPGPSQTAAEVDRHRDDDPSQLLQSWAVMGPVFEQAISEGDRWPALVDVLSHEHDVRGALGAPEARDHPDLVRVAHLLTGGLPDGVRVVLDEQVGADDDERPIRLRTTAFEFFRVRLGRRSRAQVALLDWSNDPGDLVDRMFVFGPATTDVVE